MESLGIVRNSLFYKQLNVLLRKELDAIRRNITPQYEQILQKKKLEHPLPVICQFEFSSLGANKQWRLALDFDDYEWSYKTVKPHFLNAVVSLSIGSEFIHFKYQLCSSFNDALAPNETEEIAIKKLNDTSFVIEKIKEITSFLKGLAQRFIGEINHINFNELEFIEDMEDIYQIIILHKINDTKTFYNRTQLFLLEAIKLMDLYINEDEKIILEHTRKMYSEEIPICQNTLKQNRVILDEKKHSDTNISNERIHVLDAIHGFLIPFEEYPKNDKIDRFHTLENKVHSLVQVGLKEQQFTPLIKKHFPEIYKH